jgi:hypothetical protein
MGTRVRSGEYYTVWRDSDQVSVSDPRTDLCHVGYTFFLSDAVLTAIRTFLTSYVAANQEEAWSGRVCQTVIQYPVNDIVEGMMSKLNQRIFVSVVHIKQLRGTDHLVKRTSALHLFRFRVI